MISIHTVINALSAAPLAMAVSFSSLLKFVRLCNVLRPIILHRLPSDWTPANTPAVLPPNIVSFLSHRIEVPKEIIHQVWSALGAWIWTLGDSLLGEDTAGVDIASRDEGHAKEWLICTFACSMHVAYNNSPAAEHMLYPEVRVCMNPECTAKGQTLRLWDAPTLVQVFTLAKGVYDAYSVRLSCKGKQSPLSTGCY